MNRTREFRILHLMLLVIPYCLAQTTGDVEGIVLDPSDAAVTGAEVRLVETGTNLTRTTRTNESGRYVAAGLLPGSYRVEVSLAGFRTAAREGVRLSAGRTVEADFHLELGELSQEIVVEATAPLVSTSSSDWGGTIEQVQLEDLPLNGRDVFDLASQLPATAVATHKRGDLFSGKGTQVSVNGNRPNQNSFRLDGVYMNDAASSAPASAMGRLLGVEAIEELRLIANPFSAEYGKAAGAVFTAVSRSGTNDWHGNAFGYFRNNALDARNFFDSPNEERPPVKRNQYGATVGGPIRQDKVFFLASYEGIGEDETRTRSAVTLTEAARNGDLPGGSVAVDSSVAPYLALYPLPNGRDFGDGSAEFISVGETNSYEHYGSLRGDFLFSDSLQASARLTMDGAQTGYPDDFLLWEIESDSRFAFLHSDFRWIQSPTTLHTFRFGYSSVRNTDDATPPASYPAELSLVAGQPPGTLEVTGLTDLTEGTVGALPRVQLLTDAQFNYEATLTRGRHNWRFGAGYDRLGFDQQADFRANGRYRFSSIQSLLRAQPRGGDLMAPGYDTVRSWSQSQYYFFAQDEVRLTPRLNLTLGVRYEGYTTPTEADNKIATLPDPLHDTQTTVGGPLFDNPSATNFAPRAALAYDIFGTGGTVIRAGAGMFFDLLTSRELTIPGMRVPPFFRRLFITNPSFPDLVLAAEQGSPDDSMDGTAYYVEQPYVLQFRFAVEQKIGSASVVEIGYSGTRGIHLYGQYGDLNIAQPIELADGRLFFPADAPLRNPALGRIGLRSTDFDSSYHGLTVTLRRQMADGFRFQASYTWSKAIDNSSSTSIADFANSDRNPHPLDIRNQRGPADFDVRHSFNADAGWQIPGPRGGWAEHVGGGWELHGLMQLQTGFPFSPRVGFDRARLNSGFGDLNQRPSLAASVPNDIVLGDPQLYFDPTAFVLPEAGFYGNLGRNALTGPGLFNVNLAVHKTLWKSERQEVRFRLEAFNVTNHPNFGVPSDLNLFSSSGGRVGSAGRITSTSTDARQLQLAIRWSF